MSERRERHVPSEAKEFKALKPVETQGPKTEEGQNAMRGKPEATGVPASRRGPDGNLITTEKAELNHDQESTMDIEAGIGPNPSWSDDPSDTSTTDSQGADTEQRDG